MKLEEKEKIIFKVHPHWLYVAFPEFALLVLGLAFLMFPYPLLIWTLTIFTLAWIFAMLMILLEWLR